VISFGRPRPINALTTTDLYRAGAYPITARLTGLSRNPFYERGVFNVNVRATKGFEWWKDHGIFLFGNGFLQPQEPYQCPSRERLLWLGHLLWVMLGESEEDWGIADWVHHLTCGAQSSP
jgi:hypothetical protein